MTRVVPLMRGTPELFSLSSKTMFLSELTSANLYLSVGVRSRLYYYRVCHVVIDWVWLTVDQPNPGIQQ